MSETAGVAYHTHNQPLPSRLIGHPTKGLSWLPITHALDGAPEPEVKP